METFLTYKAQIVMHCPQVVDNGALVLTFFSAPGAAGYTIKVCSTLGWHMPATPITLGDSEGDTTQKNFKPFGRVLSV